MKRLILKNAVLLTGLLLIGLILRFYFYSSALEQIGAESSARLFVTFLHGSRFDLNAIVYTNIIFLLFIWSNKFRQSRYTAGAFALLNTVGVFLHLFDIEYFNSYGKRLDLSFLAAVGGTKSVVALEALKVYLPILVISTVCAVIFYYVFRKNYSFKVRPLSRIQIGVYIGLTLVLGMLAVRGGVQKRVLSKQHTLLYAGGNGALAQLTSNTVHNLIRSKLRPEFPSLLVKSAFADSKPDNLNFKDLNFLNKKPKNIILIFIESLSSESVKRLEVDFKKVFSADSEEFLDTPRLYANGELSMDAITSVLFGLPSYFDVHVFKSKYVNNELYGIGTVLKEEGFSNFFIHGAEEGTQYFDVISKAAGIFDFYSVRDRYEAPKKDLALWGVHDEFLYNKSLEIISEYKPPFFGTLFTTSSHMPFKGTPNNLSGLETIDDDYFASIDYAVDSMTDFFKKVKKEDWFEDTLFVVTGDHSPPLLTEWNMNKSSRFKLPLAMYLPGSNLGTFDLKKNVQHIDLPVTFLNLLGIKPPKWSVYGESIFTPKGTSPVVYTDRGGMTFIRDDRVDRYVYDLTKHSAFVEEGEFKIETPVLLVEAPESDVKEALSYFGDYIYRLENDKVYR